MKRIFATRKRTFRIVAGAALTLLITLYIGFPTIMAVGVTLPTGTHTGTPPAGFTDVRLTTSDGVHLGAWYAEPQNGMAIVLVHGAGNERENMRDHASLLHDHGFGVLALNLRGHGDSDGQTNRLGWNGSLDIGAAVDFLAVRPEVAEIGALGLSLGGEVLLGAASTYPAITAIISEGATFRSAEEYTSLPSNRPLYRSFVTHIFSFMTGVFTGDTPPQPTILSSLTATENTRFLLIAAGNENDEIVYNEMFQETLGARGQLWVIPNIGHTQGLARQHDAYEMRVIDFFTPSLAINQ